MGESTETEQYNLFQDFKYKYSLTGIRAADDLNGKVYEQGEENSISIDKKKIIDDFIIDAIRINFESNKNYDRIDMFLRFNENPCAIPKNGFEMWNALNIVKILDNIKQVAKYKLFNQYGNRMKEEELVTILAYMHFEEISIDNIESFLKIFTVLLNEDSDNERKEIKMSIRNKKRITDFLEKLDEDSNDAEEFKYSIGIVKEFTEKLEILFEGNRAKLKTIFNPYIKNPEKANLTDFYVIFLILKELDTHIVRTYKKEILEDLTQIFRKMKKMCSENVKAWIEDIEKRLKEYKKHTGILNNLDFKL